jgi:quercetin dioxygenase-like cupin family protein
MSDHADPTTAETGITRVPALAAELQQLAHHQPARRTARTLVTGTVQRATLIALAEGAELAEHDSPPAATLYVISGRVRLHTHDQQWVLDSGDLAPIPAQRHGLTALTDAAVLLTVALGS